MAHCRSYLLHCSPSSTQELPSAPPGIRHRRRALADGDTRLPIYVRRMITSSSARIIGTILRFEDKYHQPRRGTPDTPVLETLHQAHPGFLQILKRIPKGHPPCRPLLGLLGPLALLRKDSVSDLIDELSISRRIWLTVNLYGEPSSCTTAVVNTNTRNLVLKLFRSISLQCGSKTPRD
jgi:hypothetical protein